MVESRSQSRVLFENEWVHSQQLRASAERMQIVRNQKRVLRNFGIIRSD